MYEFLVKFSVIITRIFRVVVWMIVLSCRTSRVGNINKDLDCVFASINTVSRNEAADGLNQVIDAVRLIFDSCVYNLSVEFTIRHGHRFVMPNL